MSCLEYELLRAEIFQFYSEFYVLDDRIIETNLLSYVNNV